MTGSDPARIEQNLERVRERVDAAAARSGRSPEEVKLIVVGKTRTVAELETVISLGVKDIGENRVRELASKYREINGRAHWHFIGTLQSNKVRQVVGLVDLIHSVDSLGLAAEIDRRAAAAGVIQAVLIQVNVSGESTKQGIEPAKLKKLVAESDNLRHIRVEGLMTIAPLSPEAIEARPVFAALRSAYEDEGSGRSWKYLSMGMSHDFEIAIEEGANMVRVGRAVFQERTKEAE